MTGERIGPADQVIPATRMWFAPLDEDAPTGPPPGDGWTVLGASGERIVFVTDGEDVTTQRYFDDPVTWAGTHFPSRTATVELDPDSARALRKFIADLYPDSTYGIPPSRRDRRHPPTLGRPPLPTEKHYPTSTSATGARRTSTRRTRHA